MKKMKRMLALLLSVMMMAAALAGCGNSNQQNEEGNNAQQTQNVANTSSGDGSDSAEVTEEEKYGGTLKVALNSTVSAQALDPIYSNSSAVDQVTQQYGEGLVRMTSNGEFVPAFATDWETSDDGLVWTFHLRKGVHFQKGQFQDGREANADDVLYSIERSRTQHWNNPLFMVDSIEKVDDYTVQITLNQPYAAFLERCTSSNTIIIPREDVEGWGDEFGLHPTSIGPFQVVEHAADQYTKLVCNEDYWGTRPYLDALEYYCITDNAQALNALLTGEVDIVLSLSADAIRQVKESDNITLYQEPACSVSYIGLNSRDEQLSDPNVRKALIMAVDSSVLATAYQEGMAEPDSLPIPLISWGYDESLLDLVPSYDPEGAKQLLADAGYPNGFKLKMNLVNNSDEMMRAATMVQGYWSQIGVELEILPVSQSEMTEIYTSGTVQTWAGTQGGYADPATILGYFTSRAKLNTNQNSWGYDKEETEQLNKKALALSDQAERKEIYKQIATDFLGEYMGIFFANSNLNMAANNRVHGLTVENKTVLTICGAPDTGVNIWVD